MGREWGGGGGGLDEEGTRSRTRIVWEVGVTASVPIKVRRRKNNLYAMDCVWGGILSGVGW